MPSHRAVSLGGRVGAGRAGFGGVPVRAAEYDRGEGRMFGDRDDLEPAAEELINALQHGVLSSQLNELLEELVLSAQHTVVQKQEDDEETEEEEYNFIEKEDLEDVKLVSIVYKPTSV